jgi:hypothetical protein
MGGACADLKNAATYFVSRFVDGRDRMGLITFMGSASPDFAPSKSFKSSKPNLTDTLAQLHCANNTGSADALGMAHDLLTTINEPTADNVIVFFTDGKPNGFGAEFPLKPDGTKTCKGYISQDGGIWDGQAVAIDSTGKPKMNSCPGGSLGKLGTDYLFVPEIDKWGSSARGYSVLPSGPITFTQSNSDKVSMNAAESAALAARKDQILIYTIGLHGDGGIDDSFLQRVANVPGSATYDSKQPVGKYYATPSPSQLNAAFQAIASDILRISQ